MTSCVNPAKPPSALEENVAGQANLNVHRAFQEPWRIEMAVNQYMMISGLIWEDWV